MIPFPCVLPCIRHACFLRGVNAAFVFMRVSRQQTNQKLIQLVKYAWRQSRTTPRPREKVDVCSQTPTQPHIKQRITSRQEISAHPRLERSLSIHSLSPSHDACTEDRLSHIKVQTRLTPKGLLFVFWPCTRNAATCCSSTPPTCLLAKLATSSVDEAASLMPLSDAASPWRMPLSMCAVPSQLQSSLR